jgi:hypothetical protein
MARLSTVNMVPSKMRYTEASVPFECLSTRLTLPLKDGLMKNRLPLVTTDPNKLEDQAKSILPLPAFNYVAGGAGERATMDANRLAFRQVKDVLKLSRYFSSYRAESAGVLTRADRKGNGGLATPETALSSKIRDCIANVLGSGR